MRRYYQLIFILSLLSLSHLSLANKSVAYFQEFQPSLQSVEHVLTTYIRQLLPEYGVSRTETLRQDALNMLDTISDNCANQRAFKRNHAFKDSIVFVLETAKQTLKVEGDELLLVESYAHKTIEEMDLYIQGKDHIAKQLANCIRQLIEIQQTFVDKYQIEFDLSDMKQRLKKTDEHIALHAYYNRYYLLFFDGNVKENYMITAIVSQDVKKLESRNDLLLIAAKKSLQKLASLEPFQGDPKLKKACEQIIQFYLYEANEEFPSVIAYLELAKEFGDFEAHYLAQDSESHTAEEKVSYERLKKNYEKSTANYEITIERTNLFRTDRLMVWQDATAEFFTRYLPR